MAMITVEQFGEFEVEFAQLLERYFSGEQISVHAAAVETALGRYIAERTDTLTPEVAAFHAAQTIFSAILTYRMLKDEVLRQAPAPTSTKQ